MGLFKMSTASGMIPPNPDEFIRSNDQIMPRSDNFYIQRIERVGEWLIALIVYPDCTNFEGQKILVYRTSLASLGSQKHLDPHFSDNSAYLSPIARFIPTEEGWELAKKFCENA